MIDDPKIRASVGELQEMVEELILALQEAKTVPLSANVMVDRHQFLDVLERLRSELPEELRAARWMVREREAFIARTNEKAREIVDRGQAESRRLVAESHIVAEAVEEANILVRRAEGEARRLRLVAEDDMDEKLQRVEALLLDLTSRVLHARQELRQARPAEPEPPY
ncbi:MAG: hypothetical protein ACRDVM_02235 [Acidimicrobiia bacterium]